MSWRYSRLLVLMVLMLSFPLLTGVYLSGFLAIDASGVSVKKSTGLPIYDHINAQVYGETGRLDYRLIADRLIVLHDLGSRVTKPVVDIVDYRVNGIVHDADKIRNQSLQIRSQMAQLSTRDLRFSRDVNVLMKDGSHQANKSLLPRHIHAEDLAYTIRNRFFEARGGVHYCQGVQEVFAEKVSGYIDQDDYVFDKGKIVFRKRSRC